jgi:hypothetical protein
VCLHVASRIPVLHCAGCGVPSAVVECVRCDVTRVAVRAPPDADVHGTDVLQPTIVDRFPAVDHDDAPLNDGVPLVRCPLICNAVSFPVRFDPVPIIPVCGMPQFCFPDGVKCVTALHPNASAHTHGAFVLTDSNGGTTYAYTLQFFEAMPGLSSTSHAQFSWCTPVAM